MDTTIDLAKYIKSNYGVDPVDHTDNNLEYHSIVFQRARGSVIDANKTMQDFWTIKRKGHSIDFYKTEDLLKAVDAGGGLLYWFIPKSRT